MQNGKMLMAFPGSFSNSFSRHFIKISAFSDCTTANCSNMLKWKVGPMSFLSSNHCLPKKFKKFRIIYFPRQFNQKDSIQTTVSSIVNRITINNNDTDKEMTKK